jgi:hypothetical protein
MVAALWINKAHAQDCQDKRHPALICTWTRARTHGSSKQARRKPRESLSECTALIRMQDITQCKSMYSPYDTACATVKNAQPALMVLEWLPSPQR